MDSDWMDLIENDSQFAAGLDVGVPPHTPPPLPQVANRAAPTLPGMEGALDARSEAQLKSEAARAIFEANEEHGPWMDDYWDLIAEGWGWRQAVYMLWEAQPPGKRQPRTQAELATGTLGLTTDRIISLWKQENPAMLARIARLTVSAVAKARAKIIQALVDSASNPNPRNHADRKMALEMSGDYVRRQEVGVGVIQDLEQASTEDLASMAQLPEWEVVEGDPSTPLRSAQGDEDEGDV